ncbi:uncharacterized protein FYW49_004713 [Xenentodon cancila]
MTPSLDSILLFETDVRVQLSSPAVPLASQCVKYPKQKFSHSCVVSPSLLQVLYDGLCPICVTEIRFLQFLQRNRPRKVHFIDISKPGYDGAHHKDVTYEMAMEEMHVIDEKDEVHRGVPAFAVMYSAVGLGWLGHFMMWSPVRPFMVKSYAIFARNRLKWTGREQECPSGRCEKKTP